MVVSLAGLIILAEVYLTLADVDGILIPSRGGSVDLKVLNGASFNGSSSLLAGISVNSTLPSGLTRL